MEDKTKIQAYLDRLERDPDEQEVLEKLTSVIDGIAAEGQDLDILQIVTVTRARLLEAKAVETAAALLDLELKLCTDSDMRADLLYEKARVLDEELLQQDDALACLDEALELRPDMKAAEEKRDSIQTTKENWEKIVSHYLANAESADSKELATSLYASTAEIYQKNNPGCAEVETYFRKSLDIDPTQDKAYRHLGLLFRSQERWQDFAQLHIKHADIVDTPSDKVQALVAAARVMDRKLSDGEGALDLYRRCLAVDPANELALEALVDGYTRKEDWEALIAVYEEFFASNNQKGDAGLYLQIGMLWWKKLGNLESAESYFRRVLKGEPGQPLVLDFYRQYYGTIGDYKSLLSLLRHAQQAVESNEEKLALAVEMAELAEINMEEYERAIDMWKGVLRLAPDHQGAATALRRLYRRTEKWNALLEVIKDEVAALSDDDVDGKVSRLLEMVDIYSKLRVDVMVVNTYNAILEIQPGNLDVLSALAERYESAGRVNDVINVLYKQAAVAQSPGERKALLRRIASLWTDRVGNHAKAIEPLEEILSIDPADREALAALRAIYEKRRNWKGLLDLHVRELQLVSGEEKLSMLKTMAELAQKRLGDTGRAIAIWNQVLELDSEHGEALDTLSNLYQREKRWPALAEVLERKLKFETDPNEKRALLESLGSLWTDRIGAGPRAIEVWKKVLELDPNHIKALRVLRDLYAQQGHWDALEELLGARGAWTDFIDALHQAADRTDDKEQQVALHFKIAGVWTEKLGKPDRAVKAYERILALEPGNLSAAENLVPIYEKGQKWPRLVSTYQVLLDHAEDRDRRLDLLDRIWRLCETRLGAKMDAFNWCAKAYDESPDDGAIQAELERLAGDAHAWKQLVDLYGERVAHTEDEEQQVALYRRMAELTHQDLNHPEDAKVFYQEVLKRRPDAPQALDALEQILGATGDWEELLVVYDKRVELSTDDEKKREFLMRTGVIREDHLNDLDGAAKAYQQVLDINGEDSKALRALERVHEARGDWRSLAHVLEQELAIASDTIAQIEILTRLGQISHEELSDDESAVTWYSKVLELDPLHRLTVAALEPYLDQDMPLAVRVAEILLPFYERTEDWTAFARCLELRANASEDKSEQLEQLRRLSEIYARKLGDAQHSLDVALRVFKMDPEDADNRKLLAELANLEGDWTAVLEQYKAAIEEADDGLRANLAEELAVVYDESLSDPEKAREYYEVVLSVAPDHAGAFSALQRILSSLEDYDALRLLLHKRAELVTDDEERKTLLFQVSNLEEDVLGNTDEAIETYRSLLEIDPGNSGGYAALERLLNSTERWHDLDELLAKELDFTESPERVADLQFRRGTLLSEHLDNLDGSVDIFQEVLSLVPGHEGAIESIESLLDKPDLRQRLASILEPLYEGASQWRKLVAILEVKLEAVSDEDPAGKVEILRRIAELQKERIADPDAAFATWRRALAIMPSNSEVRDAIDGLVAEMGDWEEAVRVWEEALDACPADDLPLRAEFITKLASTYEERLLDPDQAALWYEELLNLDPDNLDAARLAARALARLYETSAEWKQLVGILRREVDWSDDLDSRKEYLFRIAEIQEQYLGEEEQAVETFKSIMDLDAEDETAMDALERLYFRAERWNDLVGILRRRADVMIEPEQRRALWARIAMLYEEALDDMDEAVQAWTSLLDAVPDDIEAIRSLARLFEQTKRWRDLYDMLDRELALTEDVPSRVALMFRIGKILHRNLDDAERAVARYREVLELDPEHQAARSALEELLSDDVLAMQAAEILEPLYQTESNWARLCDVYDLRASATADATEKVALYRRIAEIQETGLDDAKAAFESYGKALIEAAGLPELVDVMSSIERLTSQDERWQDLVDLYKLVSDEVMDAAIQEQMRLTVADVSRHRLADVEAAREYYQKVLDASPDNQRALDALETLYTETEDYEALLGILKHRADLSLNDDDARRDYLARAAVLSEDVLERSEEAMDLWEQVLGVVPSDRQAADTLEKLYAGAEKWSELAELLERRLGVADSIGEAVALRYRLGELWMDRLDDADRALLNFRAALGGNPTHEESIIRIELFLDDEDRRGAAAEILEPIYASRQDWKRLIDIYKVRRDTVESPDLKPALTKRIAMLYEEQMEDLDQAFEWYGKLFSENPEEPGIRDQLTRLAGILDKWSGLADVYVAYLDEVFEESDITLEVAKELAEIFDDRLDDVDRAKAYYIRVWNQDRSEKEVFASLERMLTRAEKWDGLLAVYEEAADHAMDSEERKSLLLKMCQIYEEPLEKPEQAVETYRAVMDIGDNDRRAVDALERLLAQLGRWEDLTELYHRQMDYVDTDEERVSIKLRLGNIYRTKLDDIPSAVDSYEEVLRMASDNSDAIEALENLVLDEQHRFRIAQILEPIYRQLDEWKKLVVIYDAQLEFVDDKTRRVEIYQEISRLHEERGGDYALAFQAMSKAWLEDVGNRDLLAKLEELAGKLGDWNGLVTVLHRGAEESYDPELLGLVYGKMARVYERALGDIEKAVEAFEKLIQAQDDNEEAILALERLLPELGRYEELVPILTRKAEMASDPLDSVEVYYKLAEVQETVLERRKDAIETWNQVLNVSEEDELALSALERLYEAEAAWTDLVDVYRKKIGLAADDANRRDFILKLAKVQEEKLNDAYDAMSAYRQLLDMDPDDREALEALDRLYASESMWPDLLEVLDHLVSLETDAGARGSLLYRSGQLLQDEMSDTEGAIERYRVVLDGDPSHEDALRALEELARGDAARESAIAVLEPLLRDTGRWSTLVELYELRLDAETDPDARVAILTGLAQMQEQGLNDPSSAFEAYGRALTERPDDETVQGALERLAMEAGNWQGLADLYSKVLDNIYDGELGKKLAKVLAKVYEEALQDDEQAMARYRQALEFGEDAEALKLLDALLVRNERWEELAEVLQKEVDATMDSDEQAEYLLRLASLRSEQFDDRQGALDALNEVLARKPGQKVALESIEQFVEDEAFATKALDVLEPAYESLEQFDKLVALSRRRLALLQDPLERASLLERIAETCENRLSAPADALDALSEALEQNPEEPRYLDEIERLADLTGNWQAAVASVDKVLSTDPDESVARNLALRAARWCVDRLTDVNRAQELYDKVLSVDEENVDAIQALEDIFRARADIASLMGILKRKAELVFDATERRNVLQEVADLAENNLGDYPAAAEAWKSILEMDVGDTEAMESLVRLYEAAEQWSELVDVLDQKAGMTNDHESLLAIKHRMGQVLLEKMEDVDRAVEVYKDALDVDPHDTVALDALESIYMQREDWAEVQDILMRRMTAAEPGPERVPIYARLAHLSENRFDNPDEAMSYWLQVIQVDDANAEAYQELFRLFEAAERWYDLADLYQRYAEVLANAGNTDEELKYLVAAATVWENRLENTDSATEVLNKVLERDPSHVGALTALARIYENAEDWEQCQEILARAAALGPQGRDGAELAFRQGRVAETLGNAQDAQTYYEQALEFDETHEGALEAVENAARDAGDWEKVARLVHSKARHAQDPAQQLEYFCELGELYANELDFPDGGIPFLEQARELAPEDPKVLEPLANLYFAAGRNEEAETLYLSLVESLSKHRREKRLAVYYSRLGAMAERRGDQAAAIELYDKAYRIDTSLAETLIALGRLYQQKEEWDKARRIYRSMLLQNVDDQSLGVTKADIYYHLGFIHIRTDEPKKAKNMLQRGLELDPEHAGIKELLAQL
ncbi:MAG: tetratricopeptide repeat protein [Deltaproteobacteria bacterium]|nr:tetratricopeptide repeat protein [Deltaproteobacteria bacterium]